MSRSICKVHCSAVPWWRQAACPGAKTQSWLRSIPASWASEASSEARGSACLSASVGPDAKTGVGLDAAKRGVGADPGMVAGEAALVTGAGAGPWAVMGEEAGVAGVDLRAVPGLAAEVAAGVGASPLVLTKVEGRLWMGVRLGLRVGVGVGTGLGVGVEVRVG